MRWIRARARIHLRSVHHGRAADNAPAVYGCGHRLEVDAPHRRSRHAQPALLRHRMSVPAAIVVAAVFVAAAIALTSQDATLSGSLTQSAGGTANAGTITTTVSLTGGSSPTMLGHHHQQWRCGDQ